MTTDMSSAFDLVDHSLLVENLKFYGVENNACELLRNFLSNRKTFTQIQGFNSSIEGTEACSVIQGSKLSGFLFTLFSIETPLLPRIVKDVQIVDLILEMTIPQYYVISHQINQYVDDSTNLIASDTKEEMSRYLESYHKVLEKYYHSNKLKINSKKNKLIVTCRKLKNSTNEKIKFNTSKGETIEEVNALRILGFLKNNRDSYDSHLGQVSACVTKVLADLKQFTKYMDLKTRKEVIYSKAASIALYRSELYTGQTD